MAFARLTLRGRFLLVIATVFTSCLVLFVGVLVVSRAQLYEGKRSGTRHVVEVAHRVAKYYADRAAGVGGGPAMSTEEAQQRAIAAIKALRYRENDYFWINDMHPRMVMHPTNPKLDGTDLSGYADPNGTLLFVEFVKRCRESGSGFVEYMWPKPGATAPQPKISYVMHLREWDWVIGSGIYVDDVQAEFQAIVIRLGLALLGVLALSLAVAVWAIRTTVRPIVAAVQTFRSGAAQVVEASSQLADAAQSLSNGASQQAASLEETSASMEEMSATTTQNAGHAREVSTVIASVRERVDDSNRALAEMDRSMTAIREASGKVSRIIKTIDEIAFQTNILALNAAVEAARAGAEGMGFAVVADEVRSLAQRSAQAARETAPLIEDALGSAAAGNRALQVVAASITGITESVAGVVHLVDQVGVATREQAQGISQITQAVGGMQRITQTAAATAEETAAAAEELTAQARITEQTAVDLEHLIVGGVSARREPAAPPQAFAAVGRAA